MRRRFADSVQALSLLAALPVVALALLGADAFRDARTAARRAADDTELAALDARFAATISAVLEERGLDALASAGVVEPTTVAAAAERGDAAMDELLEAAASAPSRTRHALSDDVPSVREALQLARTSSPGARFDRYGDVAEQLNELAARAAATASDGTMLRELTALVWLHEFGDAAGRERALVAGALAADAPMSPADRVRWDRYVEAQGRALAHAAAASPSLAERLEALGSSPETSDLERARSDVEARVRSGGYEPEPLAWYNTASARSDLVAQHGNDRRRALAVTAASRENDAEARSWLIAAGLVALVAAAISMQIGLVREVRNRRAAQAAESKVVGDMQRTLDQLEAARADLERFSFVAAHDLRSSLRQAASFADLYDREIAGLGNRVGPRAAEFRDYARRALARMDELLGDILTYMSLQRTTTQPSAVDLDAVVDDVLTDLAPEIPSDATIVVDSLPMVQGDERLLRLALGNLLQNAVKYRRDGVPLEIEVDAVRDGATWRIRGRDNGLGIAPEHRERIFDLFRRLHGPEEYGGTGLGLAICRRVAALHGGRVDVESKMGEGSVFTLVLAVQPPGLTEPPGPPAQLVA